MSIEKTVRTFYIHKSRKLTDLFKDAFQYMSDEARNLTFALSLFSISLFVIALLVAYIVLNTTPRPESLIYQKDSFSKPDFMILILCCLTFVIGICTLTLILTKLLLLRDKNKTSSSQDIFAELKKDFPEDLRNYLFNFFIIYFIYYVGNFAIGFLGKVYIFSEGEMDPDPINYSLDWLVRNVPVIIIVPLFMYFGFCALFLSIRDNIGSSDALKKIYDLSQNKLKQIWINSTVIFIVAYFANELIRYCFYYMIMALPYNENVFFIITSVQKLLSLGVFVFMQIAAVLMLGSVEDDLEGHYIRNKINEI